MIAALLQGSPHSREAVIATVKGSRPAAKHQSDDLDLPPADIDCAVAVDAFEFAMKTEKRAGRLIAKPFFNIDRSRSEASVCADRVRTPGARPVGTGSAAGRLVAETAVQIGLSP